MLRNDNYIFKFQARSIIEDFYGKNTELKRFDRLSGGKSAKTYRIISSADDKGILVRVAHVHKKALLNYEKIMMSSEQATAELLLSHGIYAPKVLKYCPYGSVINREYAIYEFIENSKPTDWNKIDCSSLLPIIESFHKIQGKAFGFCCQAVYGSWFEFIFNYSEELFQLAKKHRLFKDIRYIEDLRSEIINSKELFNEIVTPYFVHNDIGRKNFLYEKDGERFVYKALIDMERSMFGDIDFDLGRARLTDGVLYQYIIEHTKDENMSSNRKKRLRIYSLLQYMKHMYLLRGQYWLPFSFKIIQKYYIQCFNDKI